jgi:hypothetical protein
MRNELVGQLTFSKGIRENMMHGGVGHLESRSVLSPNPIPISTSYRCLCVSQPQSSLSNSSAMERRCLQRPRTNVCARIEAVRLRSYCRAAGLRRAQSSRSGWFSHVGLRVQLQRRSVLHYRSPITAYRLPRPPRAGARALARIRHDRAPARHGKRSPVRAGVRAAPVRRGAPAPCARESTTPEARPRAR